MDSENLRDIKREGKMKDERRYIAEVLSGMAKLVMSQLGHDFQVEAKANFKEVPLWVQVKVQPYSEAEEPEEFEEVQNDL